MAKAQNPAPGQTAPVVKAKRIKVRATTVCYYDHKRRREGDVFVIDEKDFSKRGAHERVDARTPESITTGAEDLKRQHDELLAAKSGTPAADDADPIG